MLGAIVVVSDVAHAQGGEMLMYLEHLFRWAEVSIIVLLWRILAYPILGYTL